MTFLRHLAMIFVLSVFVFFLFVFCVAFSEREKPTSQLILNPETFSVSLR